MFERVLRRLHNYYLLYIKRDARALAVRRWLRNRGDSTLRVDYELSEDSIVFDVGGYEGNWSQQIAGKYNPHIYIFEPVPTFYALIVVKFKQNSKVSIFNFGLLDQTKTESIALAADESSIYGSENKVAISVVDIAEFLSNNRTIEKIDLIKINIEGGEFPLLKRMIERGIVERCLNIQVQFHDFYSDAIKLREEIRDSLQRTHFLTYDYHFVWENWRKKP